MRLTASGWANSAAMNNSMKNFPWVKHLSLDTDPNWQVKAFAEIFLNVLSNFIQRNGKNIPWDPSRIDQNLKPLLKKKDQHYRNYKKPGYSEEDKQYFTHSQLRAKN